MRTQIIAPKKKIIIYLCIVFLIVGACCGLIMANNKKQAPVDKTGAIFVNNEIGGEKNVI